MTETVNIGDSFYKKVSVTYEEDSEEIPVDLSIYDDNYIAIKRDRKTADSEAYIFKKIPVTDALGGILTINLSPEETTALPEMTDEIRYIEGFVQIGSTINGQIHEVSAFKLKTRHGGIGHITPIDKSYDMGCLSEPVGWVFDAGSICETVVQIEYFGTEDGLIIYNGGMLTSDSIEIVDFGKLDLEMPEIIDFGYIRDCTSLLCK
jgi:hypothetical protein